MRIRTITECEAPDPVARDLGYCQGAAYNRGCPGGWRQVQWFRGLWLCPRCWPHRVAIARRARSLKRRNGHGLSGDPVRAV